ncbi:exonuclease SbcCD subunit D [Ramlibacter tataouinensis]|uniref:exonuclease SbcCD subunit D n=1 Tax=Ramlibacter tataouinensis TaxID=94132 RepID=UPI0022F3801C|nr:exonuclease SbcCD subunit D [Ramlibacter tataouinensis]WBY02825.1 exonuclease SbcCD subunit D [Ramlibacter tataouinensis]
MKFLHTADWHLGRWFHGSSLLDDQHHVLQQLVALAADEQVDAVVIAGDVYDRAVPPADAVALLGEVLEQLIVGHGIPVILIAGNHDSAERIGFSSRILERQGLFVRGTLGHFAPVVLGEGDARVAFHPLPYVEPTFARALPGGEAVNDHASAMAHVLAQLRAAFEPGRRNVLVGHAFVAGGSESESERPLSVGGSGAVPADSFAGFDYVALGHLHRPQPVGSARIRYSGSLLKYSFQEADHAKSVSVVRMGADGGCEVTEHRLSARRDVRVIRGTLQQLLEARDHNGPRDDYLSAHLTDPGPVFDPMGRLREAYPQLMEIRFARHEQPAGGAASAARDHRRLAPADLFQGFWRDVQGRELAPDHLRAFEGCAQPVIRAAQDGEGA